MNDIRSLIEKYEAMLPTNGSISYETAELRASEFLVAQAKIADLRHLLTEEKIKLLTVQTAVYAQELFKGTAKTMTENKVTAEASETYTAAREDLERIENDIAYLKTYADIFLNAHLFYRQMLKDRE